MELASDHSFPRHAHDEYGIGVILSGAQRSWSGVGLVESLPGDVITVNPGELHDGHPIRGAVRRWRIIYFDPIALRQPFVTDAHEVTEFRSPSLQDHALGCWVNCLFDRLVEGTDLLGIEEIVAHAVQRLSSPTNHRARDLRKYTAEVNMVRARIDDDPSSPVTLAELAEFCGMSRYQIVRAFSRELGITPHAYVIQRRVRLARELLEDGEPLATAALLAGFSDQSHMTRAFGRQFGIPPGRYLSGVL